MGVNKFIGIGNLGRDPDTRYTESGLAISNFSIAINEKYKEEEKTEWVNVVAFGKLAEICQEYLHKGKQVYIEGRLQTRKWEDKSGTTRYTTEVVVNQMQMLGGKGEVKQEPSPPELGDIPF